MDDVRDFRKVHSDVVDGFRLTTLMQEFTVGPGAGEKVVGTIIPTEDSLGGLLTGFFFLIGGHGVVVGSKAARHVASKSILTCVNAASIDQSEVMLGCFASHEAVKDYHFYHAKWHEKYGEFDEDKEYEVPHPTDPSELYLRRAVDYDKNKLKYTMRWSDIQVGVPVSLVWNGINIRWQESEDVSDVTKP